MSVVLENLKKLRAEAGVSQAALAEAIGVTQQSINKYENHNVEPDIESLKRMADFFDTSIDYIVGHSDLRFRPADIHKHALNSAEARMIDGYRALTPRQQECVDKVIDTFNGK